MPSELFAVASVEYNGASSLWKSLGGELLIMSAGPVEPWSSQRDSAALRVHLLGMVDFPSLLILQQRLSEELSQRNDRQGILLFCEHPPLVTIGRDGSLADLNVPASEFIARGMAVRQVARGGGTWVQGPGQLAVYSLLPLQRLGIGLRDYRRKLEEAVIATAADLSVPAVSALESEPAGVTGRCGQFAFIGGAVQSWISQFGLVLNVNAGPASIPLVNWRVADDRVTSLSAIRQRLVSMASVRTTFVRHLAEIFGYSEYHAQTGHPWLRRTVRKVHVPADSESRSLPLG